MAGPGNQITIATIKDTPVGTYPITVTGTSFGIANKTKTFNLIVYNTPTLTVSTAGNGTGTVTGVTISNCSTSGGVTSGTCTETVTTPTSVTLAATPTPGSGSTFTGWSGSGFTQTSLNCAVATSTGTCRVTINGPVNVTATFAACPGDICDPPPTNTTVSCLVATTTGANNSIDATFTANVTNLTSGDTVLYSWDGNAYDQPDSYPDTLDHYRATYLSTPTSPQEVWAHEYSGGTMVNTGNALCPSVTVPTPVNPTVSCSLSNPPVATFQSSTGGSVAVSSSNISTPSGGTGTGYEYQWSNGIGHWTGWSSSADATLQYPINTPPGSYQPIVQIKDSSGTFSIPPTSCGSVKVPVTPGGGTKPELWPGQPGDNTSNPSFSLYFSDQNFGPTSAPLTIHRHPGDSVTVSYALPDNTVTCQGILDSGPALNEWTGGGATQSSFSSISSSVTLHIMIPGIYTIHLGNCIDISLITKTSNNIFMAALENLFATNNDGSISDSNKVEIDVTPSTVREQ
jgi:hypothetical protein